MPHALNRYHVMALAAGAAMPAFAPSTWPARPVRSVVPFAPAGTTDLPASRLAPELQRAFGQHFIIENRPGASGNRGSAEVANTPP